MAPAVPASPRQTSTSTASTANPPASTAAQPQQSSSRQTSTPASRRASQIYPMSPPPLPLASPGHTTSQSSAHQQSYTHAFPPLSPGILSGAGAAGYMDSSSSSVPLRHPRPMTAAEMHLELEKEQEAVVNRLTRELSALRAHSASVASTASMGSSASGVILGESNEHNTASGLLSASSGTGSVIYPTSSRRHRSSSSVSRSAMISPGSYSHRYSISSQPAGVNATSDPSSTHAAARGEREHRSSSIVSTPRYEEVALQKAELEEVKRENEVLKERIRELERLIRGSRGAAGNGVGEERGRTGRAGGSGASTPGATTAGMVGEDGEGDGGVRLEGNGA